MCAGNSNNSTPPSKMDWQRRVDALEEELREREQDVVTAAELGKKLLEENQKLNGKIEELSNEYSERIESLEQERYSLRMKLDSQASSMAAAQEELEAARKQVEHKAAMKAQRLDEIHSAKVQELKRVNQGLECELEKQEVLCKGLKEKLQSQEDTIRVLKTERDTNSYEVDTRDDDLKQQLFENVAALEDMRAQVADWEKEAEVASVEKASLLQRVEALEEECVERSKQANSWYDALQEEKEKSAQLSAEVDVMKLDLMGDPMQRMGNSLFGEVEDKRMEAEMQLIGLKVKYSTLESNYKTIKQQNHVLQANMSAFLCRYATTSADKAHMQRLNRQLDQANSENQSLLTKINKLEMQLQAKDKSLSCGSSFVDFGDKKLYIDFLENSLDTERKEKAEVTKELELKRKQLIWEGNKLREAETKLHHSEQEQARLTSEATKLRLKLQEAVGKEREATALCKQLECEKKYMEEQIKGRRLNQQHLHHHRQSKNRESGGSRSAHSDDVEDSSTRPYTVAQGQAKWEREGRQESVLEGPEEEKEEKFVVGLSGPKEDSKCSISESGRKPMSRKPINILDMEQELNKKPLTRKQQPLDGFRNERVNITSIFGQSNKPQSTSQQTTKQYCDDESKSHDLQDVGVAKPRQKREVLLQPTRNIVVSGSGGGTSGAQCSQQ